MTPESLTLQRQTWRQALLGARQAMLPAARAAADAALDAQLRACLNGIAGGVLGFYWPIQAEFDARPAVAEWLAGSHDLDDARRNERPGIRRAVLPVVISKNQPLRFREWTPATTMQSAGFGTFVPSSGEWLTPTVLLIPLVGFDAAGYRLGYGGGFYDRTLAMLQSMQRTVSTATTTTTPAATPITIGIGYAAGRLASIHPQPHDLKLDALITA